MRYVTNTRNSKHKDIIKLDEQEALLKVLDYLGSKIVIIHIVKTRWSKWKRIPRVIDHQIPLRLK